MFSPLFFSYYLGYVRESFEKWQKQYDDNIPWKSLEEFLERYQLGSNLNISLADSMRERKFSSPLIEGLVSGITVISIL